MLLHESQLLTQACRIVGIQHSRQRFGGQFFRKRANEIALTEFLKVKIIRCSGGPKAKRIDGSATVPDDGEISRYAEQTGWLSHVGVQFSANDVKRAVQLHLDTFLGSQDLPGIRAPQPMVRPLFLPAVLDRLLK